MRWRLFAAQLAAILRIEVKRTFLARRAIPVYLLAAMMVAIFALHALWVSQGWQRCSGSEDLTVFAGIFQIFYLRLAVFFGAVAIFLNLFRGEVMEKTLHYWFLAPVRREVLVAGKYLSGLLMSAVVFGAGTLLSYLILYRHLLATRSQALAGPALASQLPAYLGVTLLACAGYGAFFLILGLLFRNPIIPTASVLVWESLIMFLPPALKKISVIFYLESLCPVKVPFENAGKIFAISAEPTPAWLATTGLLVLAAAVVALAGLRIRRMEIRYGTEQ